MSSGHRASPRAVTAAELNAVLKNQDVRARLSQKPTINRSYDIPYLAGYSTDARTIYIDRHLPVQNIKIAGRSVNVLPFLLRHETVEKALIDLRGFKYAEAHAYATAAEEKLVRDAGINSDAYEHAIAPYIKADEHDRIRSAPPDLDLEPYHDSHDEQLLRKLRAAGVKSPSHLGAVLWAGRKSDAVSV